MKIGLNATCFDDRPSGAKQRFIGIYGELFKRLRNDEFVVYEPVDCRLRGWFDPSENVTFKKTPLLSQNRLQKFVMGKLYWQGSLGEEHFDIFEEFSLPLVKAPTGSTLLTIHDVRGINENYGWCERTLYKHILKRSLAMADHVVTVSESMREEIQKLYPQVPVSVVYNGINVQLFRDVPEIELDRVKRELELPEEFLLTVGHFEKRKNYHKLIDALAKLHEDGAKISLVIVGNDSGELNSLREKVKSRNLSSYVIFVNGLPDIDVRCLYNLCRLVVFPSSYEGFGIPILEAMAAGRPFVLSDIPVFVEITEGRCIYFPCADVKAIAGKVNHLLLSPGTCNNITQYGSRRVQDFDFQKISVDLQAVYESFSHS